MKSFLNVRMPFFTRAHSFGKQGCGWKEILCFSGIMKSNLWNEEVGGFGRRKSRDLYPDFPHIQLKVLVFQIHNCYKRISQGMFKAGFFSITGLVKELVKRISQGMLKDIGFLFWFGFALVCVCVCVYIL